MEKMKSVVIQGAYWYIFAFKNTTVAVPTVKAYANARLLKFTENHIFLHWKDNYNTRGDFSTELMKFSYGVNEDGRFFYMDEGDFYQRNQRRRELGLMPISK